MASSIVKVIVTGDAAGLEKATSKSVESLDKLGGKSSKVGQIVAGGFASIATGAIAFGLASLKSADVFETAQAQLKRSITDTGGNWDAYKGKIKAAQDQGVDFGFKIGDTENALAGMTTGLGDANEALKLLPLAQNIAKGTGKDLADSGILVTKAYEGNTKALKQLGIDLPIASTNAAKLVNAQKAVKTAEDNVQHIEEEIADGRIKKGPAAADALSNANINLKNKQDALTTAQSAGKDITDALTKRYNGSAAAAADTFAGKQAKISAQFDAVKVHAGLAIENGLVKLVDWYNKSGGPMLDRFDSGLSRISTDFGHIVNAITDIINAGGKLAQALGLTNGSGNPGSISLPNSQHPTPGAPNGRPYVPSKFYGPLPVHKATGGPVSAMQTYRVNERGEEFFTPTANGSLAPAGSWGGNVIVNMPAGADPDAVATAIARNNRRNGL